MPNNKRGYALISVSNKDGIIELAQCLHELGFPILSTGGSAKLLKQQQLPVTEVSEYTKSPEIMDGRVKTLHPAIHGGILARPGRDDDVMAELNIDNIDLVIVNLYPFQETINKPDCHFCDAIDNIDIGGPTLIRAAAKNHQRVSVVVDPRDYLALCEELSDTNGKVSQQTRDMFAQKAFIHTAHYDSIIADYLSHYFNQDKSASPFPATLNLHLKKQLDLRYGENPHQQAALYVEKGDIPTSVAGAVSHQGKPLSYNNIADTDAALTCVKMFTDAHACVIVKHANPCGVATGHDLMHAYEKAYSTDPTSAFGGIIAFNRTVNEQVAEKILAQQFVEVIIAPAFTQAALTTFSHKPNVRILSCGPLDSKIRQQTLDYKRITGGLLIQHIDNHQLLNKELKTVSQRSPSQAELTDLLFAWKVCQFVKSNAIVYAKDQQTIGIGAGQMSRIHSAKIAALKAAEVNLPLSGSVMASDAFFPFRDSIDAAQQAGITAIISPGGSIRDAQIIEAANQANIALIFTGIRHFLH